MTAPWIGILPNGGVFVGGDETEKKRVPQKLFVSPNDLRLDSFKLGAKIYKSGFCPDFMIALWRGGAPIGMYVQELFDYAGWEDVDHIAIRTSKYKGIDQASTQVKVYNLGYLVENLKSESKVLIIDDIDDTGLSIEALIEALAEKLGPERMPKDIKIAALYDKPTRNKTGRHPDYFIHPTDRWIVFPHELKGLSKQEISDTMGPEVMEVLSSLGI